MINGINSYSSYNYTNTFSNNTSNIKSSNVANDNSSLVSDKSRAVSKMLGYGVDKDGFFTSDFNEAAGLPKDYKIYAKDIENFVNIQTKSLLSSYINIDIAKSIGNAYKVFSQLLNDELNNKINFTKEDLVKIPQGFEFNQNTLEINKKYNLNDKEYKDFMSNYQNYSPTSHNIKIMTFFSLDDKSDIFKYSLIDPTPYSNNDKTITKSGIFMTFFTGFQAKNYFIEGQTSILGKMQGFDKTMSQSEIDNLNKFISENSMNFKGDIFKLFDLLNSDMSIDDFKQKILEQKENLNNPTKNTNNKETSEEDKKKSFKPIQAESKNKETYKDDNVRNELVKKLLEGKFSTSKELELLFGVKFSDDDAGEFNKILSLNSTPKSIDIKA
ncbi:Cj0814 family flagellar-dependent secreted protein [Campylobacter jejuni]